MFKPIIGAIALLLISTQISAQAVSPSDSLALVDIYNSTNGGNWSNNSGWLSAQVKDWNGITVISGRVSAIDLGANNLSGSVSNSIGNLDVLQILEMDNNNMSGELPSTMANMTNLIQIDMDNNQFTGSFPAFLTALDKLESVELDNNRLTGSIPSDIGSLDKLTNLDLDNNLLSGSIPSQLGDLTDLITLDLSNNSLSGSIPSSFTQLVSLQELYMDDNMLTGSIPDGLSALSTLVRLDLRRNQLDGNLPSDLVNYPSIKRLLLGGNNLGGSIPANINNLTLLTRLDLSENNLSGSIPNSITSLTLLSRLYLKSCNLSGSIPENIGNMPSLRELDLRLNNLTGSIPGSLGNAPKLEILFLDDNQLTGQIPPGIGNVVTLLQIELDGNLLTGGIPSELGNLNLLTELDVDNNQLTGTIPSSLGGMTSLTQLNLDHNQLTGSVPSSIAELPFLRIIEIGDNQLESLPDNIGNAGELRRLLAENNNFSSIPSSLSSLTNLTRLRFNNNQLTDLPSLAGMQALKVLTLENNSFQFDDLVGSLLADSVNSYSPQSSIPGPGTVDKNAGDSWNVSLSVAGDGNSYQWYRNGAEVSGATSSTLSLSSLDVSDSGTYELRARNAGAPDLVISSDSIVLNVTGVANQGPAAINDSATTDSGVAVSVNVLSNDSDPDGDAISLDSITTGPANGSAVIQSSDTIVYTPSGSFVGKDSLQYEISDVSLTARAWVVFTVLSPNQGPAANNDSATTDSGVAVSVNVLSNDSDPDGDSISLDSITTGPNNGSAVIQGSNTIVYTPSGSFVGKDSLQYEISDASLSARAWVVFTVLTQNVGPTANNDSATTGAGVAVSVNVLSNDSDPNGDPISLDSITTSPNNGSAVIQGSDTIVYTPSGSFVGTDSLQYEISDASLSARAWVVFTILTQNVGPAANNDSATTDSGVAVSVNVLSNDSDPNGDPISLDSITTGPNNGSAVIQGADTIVYTPSGSFVGTDSLQYEISDASLSARAWVVFTVLTQNVGPTANNDSATTDARVAVSVNVLSNDSDPNGDVLTLDTITSGPNDGAASIEGADTIVYTPRDFFVGTDSLQYEISDASLTARAWVVFTVVSPTAIGDDLPGDEFWVGDNYPNPFSGSTTIEFNLTEPGHVSLSVSNVLGQELGRFVDGQFGKGKHQFRLRLDYPTGHYLYRLQIGDQEIIKSMTLR